ncbi:MAG: hypothetical protein KatS3mg131_2545 [Candidatus Tectimicrobiota bacterium]|nr:MAG: hypothetical protein KatS3mg131_2545 [Candidatus Tectomicrobia bacterium]
MNALAFDRDGTLVWGTPAGPITPEHLRKARRLGWAIGGSGGQAPEEQQSQWQAHGLQPDFVVHKRDLASLKARYDTVVHIGDAPDDRTAAAAAGVGYMAPPHFVAWLEKQAETP